MIKIVTDKAAVMKIVCDKLAVVELKQDTLSVNRGFLAKSHKSFIPTPQVKVLQHTKIYQTSVNVYAEKKRFLVEYRKYCLSLSSICTIMATTLAMPVSAPSSSGMYYVSQLYFKKLCQTLSRKKLFRVRVSNCFHF